MGNYNFRFNWLLQLALYARICITISQVQCYSEVPYYTDESLILETVNGKIIGSCEKIEINDPSNPNMIDYIISWKSKKHNSRFYFMKIINQFFAIKGIPYATPPINENRFKKPLGIKSWTDIKDGTKWPNVCMQPNTKKVHSLNISEDCLYLNVFVSANSYMKYKKKTEPKKSILLYIHGGFFRSGSSVYYDPSIIVALSDIIVVTIQYRLGPFGFMHLAGSDVSSNYIQY